MTTRLSDAATPTDDPPVLEFGAGIPGFGPATRFVLSDLTADGIFQVMTCIDEPDLSLIVASPWLFFPEYAPALPQADQDALAITAPEAVALFCAVVVDEDALHMNLRAPFVANAETRSARQVILDDEHLPLRAPIAGDASASAC